MNDEQLKALIDEYKESILNDNDKTSDRSLMALAKEIERETRHTAMKLTYLAAEHINNLNRTKP